jgi:sugar phosphate permease
MSRAEAQAGHSGRDGRTRWRLALALAVTLLVAYYDRLNISFAIPLIAKERGWTPEQTGDYGAILMGLFYVGYGLSNLFLTPFGSRVGPRIALLVMVCLWSLMTALGAIASQVLLVFMASRVLLGLAEGVHFPMMSRLTKVWFPLHERSRANALWIAGIYLAVLSSPLVLVPAMHSLGWRAGFLLLSLAGLAVSLPVVARGVFDRPADHPRIGDAEREYIESHAAVEHAADENVRGARLRDSILTPTFAAMLVAGILNNVVALGLSGWLPTYLAGREGVQFEDLSYLAALPYAASFLGLVAWAQLGDRTGRRAVIAAVGYLVAGGCIYAGFHAAAIWATIALFAAATFFIASFTAAEFALIQRMLPARDVASGSGIYNGLTALVGGGLGPTVVKGVVAQGATAAALLPVVVPCALIAVAVWLVSRRLRY